MKKLISILIGALLFSTSVSATVAPAQIADVLTEETVLTLKSTTLTSKANPLKVSLVTVDGTVINLTPVVSKTGSSAQILLPSIPDSVDSLVQVTLKISGGNVKATTPQEFARILAKKPAGFVGETIPGNVAATATSLPTGTVSGIIAVGPQGPKGDNGDTGARGIDGSPGPQGPVGPVPANYPGANIIGDVASSVVFTGSLAGDVTGPMSSTAIANSVVTGKVLNGTYTPAVGTVILGDTIQGAIAKLDGNIQATTSTAGTLTTTLGAPTSSNTANEIVKRDASGNFAAGTITATSFSGPLTGNVTGNLTGDVTGNTAGVHTGNVTGNLTGSVLTASQANITTLAGLTAAGTTGVTTTFSGPVAAPQGVTANLTGNVTGNLTGNVTGNISGSAATFTGSLSGDVGGTQSATTIANSVVTGKVLNGTYTPAVGTVVLGDTIQGAIAKLDANEQADKLILDNATDANTAGRLVKRDGSGNFAANIVTATKFSGNLSGLINSDSSAQPNLQSLSGLQNIGSGGVPITVHGPVTANSLITGTITHANNADTANVSDSFSGSLAGDVTGTQSATAIASSVVTGKLLNGTYTPGAGVVTLGDSIQGAIQKLDGNIAANTASIVSVNGNVLASKATLAAATAANTVSTLVLRDGSGNFAAGTVTATSFSGPLTGNVTGDLTGNSAGTHTGPVVGNVTGNVTGAITGNVTGDVTGTADRALKANSLASTLGGTGTLVYADAAMNYNTIIRATAATDVTLPTSGTLATYAIGSVTQVANAADVTGLNFVKLTTSGTDLDTLTGGVDGQRVTIVFVTATNNVLDGGTLALDGNFTAFAAGSTLELIYDGSVWHEISRSSN